MKRHSLLVSILVATTALGGAAYAAEQVATPSAMVGSLTDSPAQKAVDRDVLTLSADGAAAFRDMSGARFALFEGDPARAKALIERARTALARASGDHSVYMKDEAALTPLTGARTAHRAEPAKAVAWLPVDGQLTLGEDFVPTPKTNAALAEANHSLQSGDRKGAAETLRLAGLDVNATVAVLPLAQTSTDVQRAAGLIEQGRYYEANLALKQAEDRMRFDVSDIALVPEMGAATAQRAIPPKSAPERQDQARTGAPGQTGQAPTGSAPSGAEGRAANAPLPDAGPAKTAS
ncbi:YfdX family protein [Methylobacterium sp. Leaf118]|uniref:YfdX family protein n=1 Tax=Methylobacterium sp. Leaf118 TaxID=2876562 RepID=UPI001E3DFDF8|nr:YfdX family protein [Methylobacterium sp. Leaf118]